VTNVWLGVVNGQRLSGAAKWADIIYEIDNQSVLYHLLHNVIDGYLKCFLQDGMKISLAVQGMSGIVAAAVDTHVTAGKEKCFKRFIILTALSCNSVLNSPLLYTTISQSF
jgi:hypothetical protein